MAVPFDDARLRVEGVPEPVAADRPVRSPWPATCLLSMRSDRPLSSRGSVATAASSRRCPSW